MRSLSFFPRKGGGGGGLLSERGLKGGFTQIVKAFLALSIQSSLCQKTSRSPRDQKIS